MGGERGVGGEWWWAGWGLSSGWCGKSMGPSSSCGGYELRMDSPRTQASACRSRSTSAATFTGRVRNRSAGTSGMFCCMWSRSP